MRPALVAIAAILFAFTAAAEVVITSVTPNEGPVAGGTTVIIKGSGFSNNCDICSPPFADPLVTFGNTEAASVRFIDSTTLEVVTPARIPGTIWVTVRHVDGSGSAFLDNAFTFTGAITDAFEPILFPIFSRPLFGQFGSEFRTFPRVFSNVDGFEPIYGVDTSCTTIDPPIYPNYAFTLAPQQVYELIPHCSTSIGHLFWVRKEKADLVFANLRVGDVTRQGDSHGVEIPVVRRRDFRTDQVTLLGVPIDDRYRHTLRIYSLERGKGYVIVEFRPGGLHYLPLIEPANEFEPYYAVFTRFPTRDQFPAGPKTVNVIVGHPRDVGEVSGPPTWAFVTVTNNETQHITTVTPN